MPPPVGHGIALLGGIFLPWDARLACQGFYDVTQAGSLFQDSAFTTPAVATSDPVGGWKDVSGNGNHFTQPGAVGLKPILLPGIGLQTTSSLAGSGQFLTTAGTVLVTPSRQWTVVLGVRTDLADATNQTNVLYGEGINGSTNNLLYVTRGNGNSANVRSRGDPGALDISASSANSALEQNTFHYLAAQRDGAGANVATDRALTRVTTATGGPTAVGPAVTLHSLWSAAQSAFSGSSGSTIAFVGLYQSLVSDGDLRRIYDYMKARGVALA